jgi:lysophospholipase L1-like esterase
MSGFLVQNGKQSFSDVNGRPLIGGKVYFFAPGTDTPKDTWQDYAQTVLNTNPVILDARGEASIYGGSSYRQVLRDSAGNLIWDQYLPDLLKRDAADINYTYPDGVVRPLQTLATKNDPLLGSAGIAHNDHTVRDELLALDSGLDQAKIDITAVSLRAETGVFGTTNMLTRVRSQISVNPPVYVIGDSMLHGAFAQDLYRNSAVNLLKRMINKEFGVVSYGFVPLMSLGVGVNYSQDIPEILFTTVGGGPHSWVPHEGPTGTYVAQGLSWVSTATNNILATTIPTFQRKFFVWYIAQPGGGTFDIKINGATVTTINTSAPSLSALNVYVTGVIDNGLGFCKLECVTTSTGIVELCGFSYNGNDNQLTVNNFSNSGRRLRWLDEATINQMMNGCAMFVCALGYNDSGDNMTDTAYFTEFKKRIDWLILYSKLYEVPMIVPDFVWDKNSDDVTRVQLQRLAKETNGVYIPFPDYFQKSGQATSNSYRVDTLKLFVDGAHPNIAGHRYIAETIAKRIGLSCSSKKIALESYDWWMPLALASTGITNAGNNSDTVTAVRNAGQNRADLRVYLNGITTNVARGLWTAWPPRAGIVQTFAMPSIPLQSKTDGTSQGTFSILAGGATTANPNAQNTASQHFMFTSLPTAD